jgi:hypothetical protein
MRRFFALLTGLVLLTSVLGCNCICGKCDCGAYCPCVGGNCIGAPQPVPAGQPVHAEPIKAMPKGGE